MKIAITGHDGFIGTHLLNTLIYKKGFEKNSIIWNWEALDSVKLLLIAIRIY